jgi:uncharacterized membrane protein YeaQ/YmgE (transglycosylase-associated protein family)
MNFVGYAVVGLLIGIVARFLLPGHDGYGLVATALIGLAGGWLGGFLATRFGIPSGGGQLRPVLLSVAGAMLLLLVLRNC